MELLWLMAQPMIFEAVALAQAAPAPAEAGGGTDGFDFVAQIVSTGMVGIFLLMIIFRLKIMPTYVYDDAKADWEREREESRQAWEREREESRLALEEARQALSDGNKVYTEQVIPTLTRALDAERELLDLRREEQRRRMQRDSA